MNDNVEEFHPTMTTLLPVDHSGSFVHLNGWQVPHSNHRALLFVHDIDQQSDHLFHVCQAFVDRNLPCYAYDLRGHGRSGTLLGHIDRFETHVRDLLQVASWVKHIDQGRPPTIVANGVGALIAMDFVRRFGSMCSGMVLVAPCIELKLPLHGFSRILLRMVADLWPKMRGPFNYSHWRTLEHDSHRLTVGYVNEIYLAIDRATANLTEYHGDVLFLCPEQDTICSYHALKKAAALHQEYNLTVVDIPGNQRVLDFDCPHLGFVLNTITSWLNRIDNKSLAQVLI